MKINIKKLSKKQIVLVVIAAIFIVILLSGTIYCAVNGETPAQMITDIVKSNDEQIIGKWENVTTPGLSAYEFYDDGNYDSYLSTFSFQGNYKIEGNKLTLSNPSSNKTVVYKVSIKGDKMVLTLYEEDGEESTELQRNEFERVEHLNMKSITDVLGDLAKEKETTENQDSDESKD